MADLADILDLLEAVATAACYPNGTYAPSVTGKAIDIAQGWPMPADVDKAMTAGTSIVSIYHRPGTGSDPGQVFSFPQIVAPPVHGMTVSLTDDTILLSGEPNVGEYATVIIDSAKVYSYTAQSGDTSVSVAALMATQIANDIPGTVAGPGASITIPGIHRITVRIGAPGTMGLILHRQKQQFQIVVWAPSPADRTAIAKPIDVALKQRVRVPMPDQSNALVNFIDTILSDKTENESALRRDLIFSVQYDTLDTFQAFEVTAVSFGSNLKDFAA